MTAVWLWARADLRNRWRSWVVLGVLAGVTFGLAAAGVAGARRTEDALPRLVATGVPHAAVLPNDPAFDAAQRRAVADLPEVRKTYPFVVPFALEVLEPRGVISALIPTTAAYAKIANVLVAGRFANPARSDEVIVNESLRRQAGLEVGSTMTVGQSIPAEARDFFPPGVVPDGDVDFRTRLRVVGVTKAVDDETDWFPSSGFYAEYGDRLAGVVNIFVTLENGEADFEHFTAGVQNIVGRPVHIERGSDIFGLPKMASITGVERDGLLLFALAVIFGGVVLVGQALVRAVTAGGTDLPTWRAIGADRHTAVGGMALPAVVTAGVGACTAVLVALALSSRFPIGFARRIDLDPGFHADWLVLGASAAAVIASVIGIAGVTAFWRVEHEDRDAPATAPAGEWAARAGLPPALLIGSRLAVEPGRGKRAVPVRSALVGVIAGVVGVVGCFTFRAGLVDAASSPSRAGIVWDYFVAAESGELPNDIVAFISADRDVGAATQAQWARAVSINRVPVPAFGTAAVKGSMPFVVLDGRAPRSHDEIAFAPATLRQLDVQIGDRLTVGTPGRETRVVGTALLPATSHTEYDQSAWLTKDGLDEALGPEAARGADDIVDYLLIRWRAGARFDVAERRLATVADQESIYGFPATLPTAVVELGNLRSLPIALAIFFGLLAAATVAHALVTTVRRRRHDLAILRSIGFTRRQARVAITWQATLLTVAGLVVGIPLGIILGRLIWRWLADSFPVAYVPPLALVAVLLIIPIAIVIASLLATPPAHAATRIRPAQALRTE